MGRTDSEAAFQEFLKRIPSATNLAGGAGQNVDPAQLEAHLQQHAQQLQQQAQQALQQTGNAAPVSSGPASSAPESSTSGGGDAAPGQRNGIPRVPSLDLLRQLVMNQQLGQSLGQSAVKTEPQANPPPAAATSAAPAPGALACQLIGSGFVWQRAECSVARTTSADWCTDLAGNMLHSNSKYSQY